jgi:hypothetical protein
MQRTGGAKNEDAAGRPSQATLARMIEAQRAAAGNATLATLLAEK